jgi:hypothetical protein
LVDQRFDGGGAVGRVDGPEDADARRRHRADERRLARWKQINAIKRCAHPEAVEKGNIGLAPKKDIFKEHHAPHIGDRHRMTDHRGARARERFEEMLPALAHLADAAGAPPHMGLGVDEDRWAGRVAIGDLLCREVVDVVLGRRKAVYLTLPEGKDRAGAREPEHPTAG